MTAQTKAYYQHRVWVWNYETAVRTLGVFKTREAAESFMAETPGEEKSYSAELTDKPWPYGIYEDSFNPAAKLEAAEDVT